jgi:phosphate transport system permease protein
VVTRHLFKNGNRDVTGRDFVYYIDDFMGEWATRRSSRSWSGASGATSSGRPLRLLENGEVVAEAEALWPALQERIKRSNRLFDEIRSIERGEIGNHQLPARARAPRQAPRRTAGTLTPELKRHSHSARGAECRICGAAGSGSTLLEEVRRDSAGADGGRRQEVTSG